jgi:hypothetical protein
MCDFLGLITQDLHTIIYFYSAHSRIGASDRMSLTNNAALSDIRRVPQLGQKPRRLQLEVTRCSACQLSQRTRLDSHGMSPRSTTTARLLSTTRS